MSWIKLKKIIIIKEETEEERDREAEKDEGEVDDGGEEALPVSA